MLERERGSAGERALRAKECWRERSLRAKECWRESAESEGVLERERGSARERESAESEGVLERDEGVLERESALRAREC